MEKIVIFLSSEYQNESSTSAVIPCCKSALSEGTCIAAADYVFLPGISTMMWSTFIVKRLSAAAFLMEKVSPAQTMYSMPVWLSHGDVVCEPNLSDLYISCSQVGKAPKDRLCRRVSLLHRISKTSGIHIFNASINICDRSGHSCFSGLCKMISDVKYES